MAFKRGSTFYTELRVGDFRLPRMSTGMTDKKSAEELEDALRAVWRWGHHGLLERVAEKEVSLDEIWRAYCSPEREKALANLAKEGSDPELKGEVKYMRGVIDDPRVRDGLDMLLDYAPAGARLSWLQEGPNVTQLYRQAVSGGRTPATVRRTLHRAVSDLLSERIGRGKMLAIMADAKIPEKAETRTELLTRDEIVGLVYGNDDAPGADDELRPALALSVLTGVDRGPMLAMRVRDFDSETGHLWIPDTKTSARPRYLPLEEGMAAWARHMAKGKKPGESLTGLTKHMIRTRWETLRKDHGMPQLRWKDLRGVFATWAYQCAWDALRIQAWLGHSSPVMTQRYIKRVELLPRVPRQIADAMGLTEVS